MNNKGKLIVIEGACDGIGKTTQYNLLYEHLKKDNEEILIIIFHLMEHIMVY